MPFIKILLLLLVQISCTSSGDVLVAIGMKRKPIDLAKVVIGTALLSAGFGLFAYLLQKVDLSVMAPAGAGTYLLVTLLSRIVLKEQINAVRWSGTALLATGILLVLMTSKPG